MPFSADDGGFKFEFFALSLMVELISVSSALVAAVVLRGNTRCVVRV